ncbi:MAG TPA: nickel pincer cofactor biosynthesis protein LarC [Dehalococcoidia bacterium]|nr:nickel pincer cofactor biosynthesis protein LarC [Dehalococcoidia bacterium]
MRIAYFDCFAGASGDMILGALLDAGIDLEDLEAVLRGLPLDGYHLETERVRRGPIAATKLHVVLDADPDALPERTLPSILDLLDRSTLAAPVIERSGAIFQALAEAEAQVHGVAPEEIHFHEVGAIDSIVDIVGAVAALHLLDVDRIFCSPLPPGGGTVWSRHGRLPVPAPATVSLLARAGAPLGTNPVEPCPYELVTPTGAAILTTLATFTRPSVYLDSVSYGAGGLDPKEFPNVLRLWTGEAIEPVTEPLVLLESNLDNVSGEILGYAFERLFAAGALDVWHTPVHMKKNRPGTLLSVIGLAHQEPELARVILRETRTLGVRVRNFRRYEADRHVYRLDSTLGEAEIKVKILEARIAGLHPEFESARELAEEHNLPLTVVYDRLRAEAEAKWPVGSVPPDEDESE